MKNIFGVLGILGLVAYGTDAMAVSAGTVGGGDARYVSVNTTTTSGGRGNAGLVNAYKRLLYGDPAGR